MTAQCRSDIDYGSVPALIELFHDRNVVRVRLIQNRHLITEEYFRSFSGRRGADSRLSSAQTALMLQEETIRRLERERKGLNEKITALDSSLAQAEADRRQLRDKVAQLQQNEAKSDQEKEAMRAQIENAESRLTKVELKKRSVEGETLSIVWWVVSFVNCLC